MNKPPHFPIEKIYLAFVRDEKIMDNLIANMRGFIQEMDIYYPGLKDRYEIDCLYALEKNYIYICLRIIRDLTNRYIHFNPKVMAKHLQLTLHNYPPNPLVPLHEAATVVDARNRALDSFQRNYMDDLGLQFRELRLEGIPSNRSFPRVSLVIQRIRG